MGGVGVGGFGRVLGGRYEVLRVLGRGSLGVVYEGRDLESGGLVAVKVVDEGLVRGLGSAAFVVREVWGVAGSVRHRGVAEVLDVGNDHERGVCVVSEFVEGGVRVDEVGVGALGEGFVLEVAEGVLAVLAEGHARGVVHGDVKPSNVLVVRRGGRVRVKVTDYGLVRVLSGTGTRFTRAGEMIGGAAWTPPEEAERGAEGTAWTPAAGTASGGPEGDVYSVGCLLYGLLTGAPPFRGDVQGVLHQQVHRVPAPPSEVTPGISADWDAVIMRALAKRPEDRFADAGAMRDALEPLRASAPYRKASVAEPPPMGAGEILGGGPPRRRRALWVTPVAVLAAAGAAAYFLVGPGGESPVRSSASPEQAVPVVPSGEPVLLGHMTWLGDGVDEDVNAVRLAVDAYNATGPAVPIHLRVYDASGNANRQVLAQRAVDEGVVGIIGPAYSGDAEVVAPVLEEAGIPSVAYGTTVAGLGDRGLRYWHRVIPGDDVQGDAVAEFLVQRLKAGRVAVVHDNTVDGRPLAERVRDAVTGSGRTARQWDYEHDQDAFGQLVKDVKAFDADAVFVAGHDPGAGRLLNALREGGVDVPFVGGDGTFGPELTKTAGTAAEGAYVSCACLVDPEGKHLPEATDFTDAYRDAYDNPPSQAYAAEAYDAVTLFIRAVQAGKILPGDVNSWLSTQVTAGVTGPLGFGADGEPRDPSIYLYRVENGAFVLLGTSTEARP
ncbi:bifunctional serine/threonine-protein kinase/ABC transporter substrate-binding protein [Actinocorallia sp. A-T 12471]|uniref:bifunctional serine/threonine-protein kinase/ABC transporter substrate-binding protein n=1 Tax=Actinocorallia sp. A-T 12471 TaxID=3089813 RepID=UPI0029CDE11B|nr:bifunctional serine/threonine-protein kinase/ABC transporter substrate-binding protein [Actinocorallia sp. A-T 12471]MDX6742919.1 bifunctional serine/threonine-protein kinase/ABC transporter substrate-binding protein [Actinocorallia sp. A-T 12471]